MKRPTKRRRARINPPPRFRPTKSSASRAIRAAVGCGKKVRLFLRQGLRLLAMGLACGIVGGVALARLLAAALVDLSPLDPLTFGAVSIFLAVVALLACYVPARRATKVDPMVALRYE